MAAHIDAVADEILNLNVGGYIYTTSRSTLTRYPDSMLGSMFGSRLPNNVDDHDRYVIDRDGPTFRHILNFLRQSKLILPDGFQEWDILSTEAEYYQLEDLIQLISDTRKRLRQPDTYEFVEVEFDNRYYWRLFGKPKLIDQLLKTDINYFIDKNTRKEGKACTNETGLAEYTGYLLQPIDRGMYLHFSRLRLFQGITKFGFTLISTSSNDGIDKWTFSRKEVADD